MECRRGPKTRLTKSGLGERVEDEVNAFPADPENSIYIEVYIMVLSVFIHILLFFSDRIII